MLLYKWTQMVQVTMGTWEGTENQLHVYHLEAIRETAASTTGKTPTSVRGVGETQDARRKLTWSTGER